MSARRRARSAPSSQQLDEHRGLDPDAELDDDSSTRTQLLLRPRRLTAWTSSHDNGWRAIVCEQPDRTFAVLVAPPLARGVEPNAIAPNADAAKQAAEDILRVDVGHERCTPQCRHWQLERHLVMVFAEEAIEFEDDLPS